MSGITTKYEKKIFLPRFPLSRLLAKTLRVKKIAMKKFLKKSVFRSQRQTEGPSTHV